MDTISVRTSSRVEFVEISAQVRRWLKDQKATSGVLTLYVPHTTAAVTINEHADPSVVQDITKELNKVIPFDDNYRHLEGNAAAHIKSSLVGASLQLIVEGGDLVLGTWQGIFFAEFDGPHSRKVHLQLVSSG